MDAYPDYNDVWSLLNIGATATEISVLRGDLLVFTRSIPTGGNTLTQALVDALGLSWGEAFAADLPFWIGDLVKTALVALVAAEVHRAFPQLLARRR